MTDSVIRSRIGKSHQPDFFGVLQTGGVVYEGATPGSYLVRLHAKKGGQQIMATVSDTSGAYSFTHLDGASTEFYAVAFDHGAGPSSPAISDTLPITDMVIVDF